MNVADAFLTLTGHPPMRWQKRLLASLLEGRVPSAIDLPTGLGKTAIIALWLIARASGAALPRRLVYMVDRRAVVDQATEVAAGIAEVLGNGMAASPSVAELRKGLDLEAGRRLPVSTLRGQLADNRVWLESAAAPAIVVGTIDMIGSRLLFEGYGVSAGMRPVHAGLLGADVLAVLDEAHLVPPFEALVTAIASWPRSAPVPRFHLLTLSATGRSEGVDIFRLTPEDKVDERAAPRLNAAKRLTIEDAPGELSERLAERAFSRAEGTRRVVIFCDQRAVAQTVAAALERRIRKELGEGAPGPALLVGGRRVREREALKRDPVFRRFLPGTEPAEGPAFLVATSAGEVGVDLDADDLVSDLVAWERMVQRLGRVNRRPVPGVARVDVLVPEPRPEAKKDEAAAELAHLARLRAPFASEIWPVGEDGRRDASPLSLLRLKTDARFAAVARAATSPEPLHPALTAAAVDSWAMTSLEKHPGRPLIAPWLRGWVKEESETRLVWRRHLPRRDGSPPDLPKLTAFFAAAPPHLTETLDVPTYQAVDVLKKRAAAWHKTDHEGGPPWIVLLDLREKLEHVYDGAQAIVDEKNDSLERAWAGRTLVIDARLGGLDASGLLDEKAADPPPTLDGDDETWAEAAGLRIRKAHADERSPDWLVQLRYADNPDADSGDPGEELRVEVRRDQTATRGDPAIARVAQTLGEHHASTAEFAWKIAGALGLDPRFGQVLAAAGAIHDAGKARDLWQNAMRAPREGRPYAKTQGRGNPKALVMDGETYRHEFGSLREAEASAALSGLPEDLRDLALHLVAAHHGFARPVIAACDPDVPPSEAAERARAAALRFARLQRAWGPWGLAWWEALLRAADWSASRAHDEQKGER